MLSVLPKILDELNSLFCRDFVKDLGEITYCLVSQTFDGNTEEVLKLMIIQ